MVNAPIVVDIIVVPDGISDVQRKQRGQYVNKLLPTDKLAGQRDRKKFNPDHSLEIFMKRYKLQLSAYAYQLLGDYDAVEDVLQQTWIDLYLRLHRYGEVWLQGTNMRAWLGAAIHNAAINYLKAQRRTIPLSAIKEGIWLLELRASQFEQPDISAARNELIAELHAVVDRLPPRAKAVMLLHYFEGYSLKEVAELLDCPLNTVKSDLRRGKQRLRYALLTRGIRTRDLELWAEFKDMLLHEGPHLLTERASLLPTA
jgi:RNA polymerase sigma-70 factor (ECF subfamily)